LRVTGVSDSTCDCACEFRLSSKLCVSVELTHVGEDACSMVDVS
jgi:hypothetical protein